MQARRTPETICWTDCACPVAPAWHDGGMGTLFERLAGFFEKRLGRSPRAALDATRLAIAFTGITFGVAQSRGFPMSLETFLYALLLIWGLATALLPILSWRADTRLAAFVLQLRKLQQTSATTWEVEVGWSYKKELGRMKVRLEAKDGKTLVLSEEKTTP